MRVGYADTDPLPKVYLGTNIFAGISLERITQLKLWICPEYNLYRAAQPVTVELVVVTNSNNIRLLTFYPWGYVPSGYLGLRKWREIDLMKQGGAWELTNVDNSDYRGDWFWIVKRYPRACIAVPPVADWPKGTITGTGLNIKLGAGKSTDRIRERESRSWWWESCDCKAYVDKLTVGYRDESGNETVKVFDFEAD